MKKRKYIFISMLFTIILFVTTPFIIASISNNISLYEFANQLDSLNYIDGVTFLEKQTICGKLNGSGNGMGFLACSLVKSELPLDDLYIAYAKIEFKTVKESSNNNVYFEVVEVDQSFLQTKYLEHNKIEFNSLKNKDNITNFYALIIYDDGYPAGFDIRGH